MTVQSTIEAKLSAALALQHLEVINESHNHNVPANSETHFKVIAVSTAFDGVTLINRHRQINEILKQELAGPVHALAIHAYTEPDWRKRNGDAPMSPPCHG
ncbi:MAG: BolA family protein [Pseudomonadales bacterium]